MLLALGCTVLDAVCIQFAVCSLHPVDDAKCKLNGTREIYLK